MNNGTISVSFINILIYANMYTILAVRAELSANRQQEETERLQYDLFCLESH